MTRLAAACLALVLAGCVAVEPTRTSPHLVAPLPAYPGYGSAVASQAIPWSAKTLAQDFAELMFETEWGGTNERLMRWERPITIAFADEELDEYRDDAAALVARIAAVAPALDLKLTDERRGDITLRTVSRRDMESLDPTALCFFVPVDMDWPEYLAAARRGDAGWDSVTGFDKITIFVPAFAEPGVFRACIIEEIAQALGPGNDIYRLEDSSYNDDGAHEWLTAFDMLMLQTLYAGELHAGMTRAEATEAAERAIIRIRGGAEGATRRAVTADRLYSNAMRGYLAADGPVEARAQVEKAVRYANLLPADDHRRGAALRRLAFVYNSAGDVSRALKEMRAALDLFEATLPPGSVRLARAWSDYGFFLTEAERYNEAVVYLEKAEPGLAAHRIDQELAYTKYLRALALYFAGDVEGARAVSTEALDWGAYVFGADGETLAYWRETFEFLDLAA